MIWMRDEACVLDVGLVKSWGVSFDAMMSLEEADDGSGAVRILCKLEFNSWILRISSSVRVSQVDVAIT